MTVAALSTQLLQRCLALNDLVPDFAWHYHRRLHSHCGYVPPAEFEATYYRQQAPAETISPGEPSLH